MRYSYRITSEVTPFMARTAKGTPPKYRSHVSGQAVVTIRRKDIYLGPYGSAAESRGEYARIIASLKDEEPPERLVAHLGPDITINELLRAFLTNASARYSEASREPAN